MKRAWLRFYEGHTTGCSRCLSAPAKILTGLVVSAACALPQAYTVSAKPGVVNYIEGEVSVSGQPVSAHNLKAVFLNANDTLATEIGKAEVLLSPGVFLRVGDHAQVRMISPSLTDTQLEVKAGEAMIEADNIVKDSRVSVVDHGVSVVIDRNGLYKFRAGDEPAASVLEGKANAYLGDRKVEIGKGHELILADAKTRKFDTKADDDLYAWSNVRAEYNAASSYQAAKNANLSSYGGVWGGYGYSGFADPGWLWNSGFNSWAWLPGNGMYYSPFGFGFYSPGLIGYAPVIYAPINNGYYGGGGGGTTTTKRAVPVNPVAPAAVGARTASQAANSIARAAAVRSYASEGGFRTASGAVVPAGRAAAASYGNSGGHASAASVSSGGYSGMSGMSGSSSHGVSGVSSAGASHGGGGGGGGSAGGGGGHH